MCMTRTPSTPFYGYAIALFTVLVSHSGYFKENPKPNTIETVLSIRTMNYAK